MAPILEDTVDDSLKDVIQDLYDIQSSVHGYQGPQTQAVLINKIHDLASDLSALSSTASNLTTTIPPEIISYVEEGRNPDIYTREFVELVQRSNQYLKGKSEAFATFRDLLAGEIVGAFPEREGEVKGILESRVGGEEEKQDRNGEVKKEEENHAG